MTMLTGKVFSALVLQVERSCSRSLGVAPGRLHSDAAQPESKMAQQIMTRRIGPLPVEGADYEPVLQSAH
jgi:hypothetical protein